MNRILVIGATGRIGREVINHLLPANVSVRALSRHPEKAALPAEVEIVRGDLSDPASLDAALENVAAVFLLWTAPPATAADVLARIAQKTERLVLLSSPHQTRHPLFQQPNPLAAFHADLERLLAKTELQSTILRPGMFASNSLLWWAPQIKSGDNTIRFPYGSVETAPIDDRDIGAVAAQCLLDKSHIGGDYVLTGPESLSMSAQVDQIGAVINRPLRFIELTADEFRQMSLERGAPPPVIDMLLNAWQAAAGHPAFMTSAVSDILGKPARTFRQWVADHAAEFRQ